MSSGTRPETRSFRNRHHPGPTYCQSGLGLPNTGDCHPSQRQEANLPDGGDFCRGLVPKDGIREINGLRPLNDVTALAPNLRSDTNIMLIGHLPFMERLVSFLTTGDIDRRVFKFQNGGIVCLDQDPENRTWYIKWTLMPNID